MSNEHGASPHKLRIIPAFLASATSKDGHAICNEMTESGEFITASGRSESLHSPNAGPACNRGRIRDSVTAGETAHICLQQRQRYAAMSTDIVAITSTSVPTSSGCVAPFFRNDKHKPSNAGIDAYECIPYGVKAMTNESISGFLNSIAEAKRAFDAEPEHLQRIADLEADRQRQGDTIASRELRIHSLKQDNDALLGKLRSVEAERDDAGFRAIQETDKLSTLLVVVRSFVGDALKAISAVEGIEQTIVTKDELSRRDEEVAKVRKENDNLAFEVAFRDEEIKQLQDEMAKAQEQLTRPFASATQSSQGEGTDPWSPKPDDGSYTDDPRLGQREADPQHRWEGWPEPPLASPASVSDPIPQGLGQSEKSPTVVSQAGYESHPAVSGSVETTVNAGGVSSSNEGQSEGPFAAQAQSQPESQTVGLDTATNETSVASSASPPERNRDRSTFFKGRKYFDVTYFVPLHQWLNDGGTREDYYWRPAEANVPLPEANRASHQS